MGESFQVTSRPGPTLNRGNSDRSTRSTASHTASNTSEPRCLDVDGEMKRRVSGSSDGASVSRGSSRKSGESSELRPLSLARLGKDARLIFVVILLFWISFQRQLVPPLVPQTLLHQQELSWLASFRPFERRQVIHHDLLSLEVSRVHPAYL